jgi:hypothetical protein
LGKKKGNKLKILFDFTLTNQKFFLTKHATHCFVRKTSSIPKNSVYPCPKFFKFGINEISSGPKFEKFGTGQGGNKKFIFYIGACASKHVFPKNVIHPKFEKFGTGK